MSTSAISSNSLNSLLESGSTGSTSSTGSSNNPMAKLWKELEAALKAGNLSEAKTSYNAIVKMHDQQTGAGLGAQLRQPGGGADRFCRRAAGHEERPRAERSQWLQQQQ